MRNKFLIFIIVIVPVCLSACRHNAMVHPVRVCLADTLTSVSFSKNIVPILENKCATVGCHTGNDAAGNLDLDSAVAYSQLLQRGTGYIDTANPKYSLLYSSLLSTADPMPPAGKLDSCDIVMVLKWITQKAPNN